MLSHRSCGHEKKNHSPHEKNFSIHALFLLFSHRAWFNSLPSLPPHVGWATWRPAAPGDLSDKVRLIGSITIRTTYSFDERRQLRLAHHWWFIGATLLTYNLLLLSVGFVLHVLSSLSLFYP